jgi:germination protein M
MRCFGANVRRRAWLLLVGAAALVLAAVYLAGCEVPGVVGDAGTLGGLDANSTTTLPGVTTTAADVQQSPTTTVGTDTTTVRVYFSLARDEKMAAASRTVPETLQVGAAAVKALLEGPTAEEKDAGMVSCIPEGTTFLGLDIKNGVATVNLSQEYGSGGGSLSMFTRLAQVVFTLTQFRSVDGVRFKLDGQLVDTLGGEGIIIDEPLDRADYEEMSPAILVESPTVGASVASPVRITGTANVFEAVFKVDIVNWDGLIIAEKTVRASSGTGTRGTFDVTVPFSIEQPGLGSVIVFSESPKDGSHINVVEIPFHLTK